MESGTRENDTNSIYYKKNKQSKLSKKWEPDSYTDVVSIIIPCLLLPPDHSKFWAQ